MTDKFAPGPWELVVNEKITIDTVDIATIYGTPSQPTEDGKGQRWLHVVGKRDNRDQEFSDIQMANAILIAAAPDLLEALEQIAAVKSNGNPDNWLLECKNLARNAIARARGDG